MSKAEIVRLRFEATTMDQNEPVYYKPVDGPPDASVILRKRFWEECLSRRDFRGTRAMLIIEDDEGD